jgi:molybdate-binding protein
MKKIVKLDSLNKINSLTDPRRLEILKLLMRQQKTVSQISRSLGEYPAGSRYHIKKLEETGLVELTEIKTLDGYVEKYYRSVANAFLLQRIILPDSNGKNIVFMGSHDLALESLKTELEAAFPELSMINLSVGSMDGLIALRQGLTQFSGCHILDADTNEYNAPLIKRFFPEKSIKVFSLAYREQGLLLSPGNPKQISGLVDLVREDISIINRNLGSGTRIWLDKQLKDLGIHSNDLNGYTQSVNSHTSVAAAIKHGVADAGLGLIAAAISENLDFIPLFIEQYDLVFDEEFTNRELFAPLMNILTSADYRGRINSLAGYDSAKTGQSLSY